MLNIRSRDNDDTSAATSNRSKSTAVMGIDKQMLYNAAIGAVFVLLCCIIIKIVRSVDKLSSANNNIRSNNINRDDYREMP